MLRNKTRDIEVTYHPSQQGGGWVVGPSELSPSVLGVRWLIVGFGARTYHPPPRTHLHLIRQDRYRQYCNLVIWRYRSSLYTRIDFRVVGWEVMKSELLMHGTVPESQY